MFIQHWNQRKNMKIKKCDVSRATIVSSINTDLNFLKVQRQLEQLVAGVSVTRVIITTRESSAPAREQRGFNVFIVPPQLLILHLAHHSDLVINTTSLSLYTQNFWMVGWQKKEVTQLILVYQTLLGSQPMCIEEMKGHLLNIGVMSQVHRVKF